MSWARYTMGSRVTRAVAAISTSQRSSARLASIVAVSQTSRRESLAEKGLPPSTGSRCDQRGTAVGWRISRDMPRV